VDYFLFAIAFIHFVQAKTLFLEGNLTHCKLGYFLFLVVGLYLPLNFTSRQASIDFFPQIVQTLDIVILS